MIDKIPKSLKLIGDEVQEYLLFKQNRARFDVLVQSGVFALQEGKAEINCHNGTIQIVNIYQRTYKREKTNIPI